MDPHVNGPEALLTASITHRIETANIVDAINPSPSQDTAKVDDHYDSMQHASCCSPPPTRPATPLSQSPQLYGRIFMPGTPSSQVELEDEPNIPQNHNGKSETFAQKLSYRRVYPVTSTLEPVECFSDQTDRVGVGRKVVTCGENQHDEVFHHANMQTLSRRRSAFPDNNDDESQSSGSRIKRLRRELAFSDLNDRLGYM